MPFGTIVLAVMQDGAEVPQAKPMNDQALYAMSPPMISRLAEWVNAFASTPVPAASIERVRSILLDTIGCALLASADELATPILNTLPRLGGRDDCTIIGTRIRASLPAATFGNGALIRLLDFNDSYSGLRQIGHPSDNIGAVLAAAELANRSGNDLVQAIRLAYEIYGRILDMGDPESPWDHVTVSGIVVAAVTGWLMRLPVDRLANAIALAAVHSTTLGEIRVGKVSGAKAIANSIVAQSASLLTLLAADGITGPEQALEGRRGFARLALDGVDFSTFFDDSKPDRLMSVGLKPYPCFVLGQGPVAAAIELGKRLPNPDALEKLTIVLADTGPARLRLSDEHGRAPTSSEAADHSIYFLVAAALLDGRFGLDQLRAQRWNDPDVRAVMSCMDAVIDRTLQPTAALPCRLEAVIAGKSAAIERHSTPGNAASPLSWNEVVDKFRHCARGVLGAAAQLRVADHVSRIDEMSSIRTLLRDLVSATNCVV